MPGMVGRMKATVEIPDALLARSKRVANESGITLRELMEEGLNLVLEKRSRQLTASIKPVTFKGDGLNQEFNEGGWSAIRDTIYAKR